MKIPLLCFIKKAKLSGATKLTLELLLALDPEKFDRSVVFYQYNAHHRYPQIKRDLEAQKVPYVVLRKWMPDWIVRWIPQMTRVENRVFPFIERALIRYKIKRVIARRPSALLYTNLDSFEEVQELFDHYPVQVLHLHLNSGAIDSPIKVPDSRIERLNKIDVILAGAAPIHRSLVRRGVRAELVRDSFAAIYPVSVAEGTRERLRKSLGIPSNDLVVGACGTIGPRKGTDWFMQAAEVLSDRENIHFVWVSGGGDVRAHGWNLPRTKRFHMTDVVSNPYDYFSIFDLFVMPSRSDGLPLALLENMSLGTPSLTFKDVVGENTRLAEGVYQIAETSFDALLEALKQFSDSLSLRQAYGLRASESVKKHFTMGQRVKELEQILESVKNNNEHLFHPR